LLPFFLQKRDYVGFALGFVLLFGFASFINRPFALLFFKNTQIPAAKINAYNAFYLALTNAQHAIILGGFAIGIKAAKNWYMQQRENLTLSKQKNRTALQLLKARIHPEFLFHSLDSLYSKIKAGSSKSPEMILNLSDQLSYILYESDEELVPLEKELVILEKLVVLDRLKNGSRRAIKLKIAGTPQHKYITPLVLLPLVQNAFELFYYKKSRQQEIDIQIVIEKSLLKLTLFIRFDTKEIIDDINWTPALQHVLTRLEAIAPDNYDIKMKQEENAAVINLNLNLSNKPGDNKNILNEPITGNVYDHV
jgi:LytS/YehU family sensor histidine kinase